LNTFKVRYNLIAAIESSVEDKIVECVKQGPTLEEMQQMLHLRRITIVTPEFSDPLLDQKIRVSSKIKSLGLMGSGTCEYTVSFEKDVLYPKDVIKLQVDINNSKCSKKIDKYKIKLLRRTQVFNLKTNKAIYTNDFILVSEKLDAKCDAKQKESKTFEFQIP
jgi:sporulation-control protein spo0M